MLQNRWSLLSVAAKSHCRMCELAGQLGQAGTFKTGVELVADGTINVEIDNNGYHTIQAAIH
ncbi:MAG: hypothetical protein AB2L24_28710 [Mangrovibacterium sp.]